MTASFTSSPLLIAHCLGLRLIALGQNRVDLRLAAAGFVLVLAGMLVGCAILPDAGQRPVSQARTDLADTRLAAVAAASMPAAREQQSGLRLLPAGDQAFEARIALARAAQKSIDSQYYQIAADASVRQFLRELAAAAARVLFSAHQFSRINRRMHNKLLVADNVIAVTGGRNIANEYFDRSGPANFIAMDMLAAGPTVQALSAVFDGYWNSEQAYPIQRLVDASLTPEAARHQFDAAVQQADAVELPVATRGGERQPRSYEVRSNGGGQGLQWIA
ncbi:MAG: hypothetical protein ABIQ82_15245 [Variovorax sp.]